MGDHFLSRACFVCTDRRVGPFSSGPWNHEYNVTFLQKFIPTPWQLDNGKLHTEPFQQLLIQVRQSLHVVQHSHVSKAHQTSTRDVDRQPPNNRIRYGRGVRSLCIAIIWKIGENSKNHIQISGV
jgi:hypothetical protein